MPPWKRMSLFSRNGPAAQELAVEIAERGAAIAGDEARRIEAVAAVQLLLHQAEPDQGLEAGHEDAALAEVVFVVELDVAQRHYAGLSRRAVCLYGADIARGLGYARKYRARRRWGNASALKHRAYCSVPSA